MTFLGCGSKAANRTFGLLPFILISLPASAAPATNPVQASISGTSGDRLVGQIIDCRGITEPDRRLECYDREVTALSSARQNRSVIVLSRSDIADKKREAFGLQQPVVATLDRDDVVEPKITELDSIVRQIGRSGRDRLAVHLADGSVWQTLERTSASPEIGDSIHIRRAALGSFIGSYPGGSIRMKRLR